MDPLVLGPVVEPGPRRRPAEPQIVGSNPTRPAYTRPLSFDLPSPTIRGPASGQVVRYLVNLEKSGYRPQTISSHSRILRLLDKSCKLEDPFSGPSSCVMVLPASSAYRPSFADCAYRKGSSFADLAC